MVITTDVRPTRAKFLLKLTLAIGVVWALARGAEPSGFRPPVAVQAATLGEAAAGERGAREGSSCAECHQFEAVLTHPVHVRPSMRTPGELPLENGLLTCTTCHDADASHPKSNSPVGFRAESAAQLCSQCHSGSSPRTKKIHTLALNEAHFAPGSLAKVRTARGGLDLESSTCVGCHDGTNASDAGSHSAMKMNPELAADHPIGVPMQATERTKHGDFKLANRRSVDHRVRFFNGKLGCGSCHSVFSNEASNLVMSNRGSRLCLSCHKG